SSVVVARAAAASSQSLATGSTIRGGSVISTFQCGLFGLSLLPLALPVAGAAQRRDWFRGGAELSADLGAERPYIRRIGVEEDLVAMKNVTRPLRRRQRGPVD